MLRFQSVQFSKDIGRLYPPVLSVAVMKTLKFLLYICVFLAVSAQADTFGIAALEGSIVDSSNNAILGVLVKLGTTNSVTDNKGLFAFKNAALGPQVLVISATGFTSIQQHITVTPGANKLPAIELALTKSNNVERAPQAEGVVELTDVSVTATESPAQLKFDDKTSADAMTESVSDNALKNTNAQNAGDYLKDVSGVSVSKGANGTSNVSVRGIDQRMLRITVDGQRQGGGGKGITPSRDNKPRVGFKQAKPVTEQGLRIEPPVSVPSAMGAYHAEIEAPEPPLEPEGPRIKSCGFKVCPPQ